MGWTTSTARPEIDRIFAELGSRYTMQRVDAPYHMVRIQYEKKLPIRYVIQILELFPDHVYVEFVPDTIFNPTDGGDKWRAEE